MPCFSTSTFNVSSTSLFLPFFEIQIYIFFLSSTNIYSWYFMQYLPFCLFDLIPKPPNYLIGWTLFSPMASYSELWFSLTKLRFSCKLWFTVFVPRILVIEKHIYILLNDSVRCIKWFPNWAPQYIFLPWILSHQSLNLCLTFWGNPKGKSDTSNTGHVAK